MNNDFDNKYCCGCGACKHICPQKCIDIKMDGNGFWKAFCNENVCVKCGLCEQVCPVNNVSGKNNGRQKYYAAATTNDQVYRRSSSGGIFPLVAKFILQQKGFVWGCGYSSDIVPMHKGITSVDELDDLCRSKYVQSYLGNTYADIKIQLELNKPVLFCGTPCQVAGLKNFLKHEYNNLYLIDIICHGVPSSGLFKKHIEYLEKKSGKKLKRYEFRLKVCSKTYYYYYYYKDGSNKTGPSCKDVYFNTFLEMTALNNLCYECPYACINRTGDLTIGDYAWGKKYHLKFEPFNEISCVISNSKKGEEMIGWIRDELLIEPTKLSYITERNKNLLRPTPKPAKREYFYSMVKKIGYERWANCYFVFLVLSNFVLIRKFKSGIKKAVSLFCKTSE